MKVLGLLGSHQRTGVNRQLLDAVLAGVQPDADVEIVFLNDYRILPDTGTPNQVLDELEAKLLAADVWVLVAPTYWGAMAGVMKNFLDCMRPRLVRFNQVGDALADRFKGKHYVTISSCYASPAEELITGMTDETFRSFDKVLSAAGLLKIREIVQTNTYGLKTLSVRKQAECRQVGASIQSKAKRTDDTVKRYIQLFGMVAGATLITMGLQQLVNLILPISQFWLNYISFVLIFFILLASVLRFFTVVKHRRH
ncbi:flavodoxin family protein [Latilactobacillus graminis]|nr:NAD(P)H-dependent oxidoreductase [Latilactobacillus graminis]QFP79433.1 NAD(P)H-dependent oxidoreductase [Latilactobacillus graminis]